MEHHGTVDWFKAHGHSEIPFRGILPATLTTPGAVSSWAEAHAAYGRLPLALSGRCYHARAQGLHKDSCQLVCDRDPDGLAVRTLEGQDFARLYPEFEAAGADIVGVSKDSVKSHDNFCAKFGFPFLLLSDGDEAMCSAFGAIVEKSMYGKKYMGIDRCTFVFDAKGKLVKDWRKVSAKGHAAEVLETVKAL
mgnify:CR=1 FL=1